jgi:hypothetical protein
LMPCKLVERGAIPRPSPSGGMRRLSAEVSHLTYCICVIYHLVALEALFHVLY